MTKIKQLGRVYKDKNNNKYYVLIQFLGVGGKGKWGNTFSHDVYEVVQVGEPEKSGHVHYVNIDTVDKEWELVDGYQDR